MEIPLGILCRIRDNLPMKARLDVYCSMIYPYMTYNVIVWGVTKCYCDTFVQNVLYAIFHFMGILHLLLHKYCILNFLDIIFQYICFKIKIPLSFEQFRKETLEIDIWPTHRLTVSLRVKIRYHSWDPIFGMNYRNSFEIALP